MNLVEKILVPIDLRESTIALVQNVIQIASAFDSEVYILGVLPEEVKNRDISTTIKAQALEAINEIVISLKSKDVKTTESKLVCGNPVDNILKYSKILDVNVICMANNFFKGHNIDALSIFTEKVIRKADKPVWVFNSLVSSNIKRLLCPIDLSSFSARALNNAILIARTINAELKILSVFSPLERLSVWIDADLDKENKENKQEHIEEVELFLSKFDFEGVNYTTQITDGDPVKIILDYVDSNEIDLVIMGTAGKNYFSRAFLGSVSQGVIKKLKCSFITTKAIGIFNPKLEDELTHIETLLILARELEEKGAYSMAIDEYEGCLQINNMHIPSHYNMAKLYRKLGKEDNARVHEKIASEIMSRTWDDNIKDIVKDYHLK